MNLGRGGTGQIFLILSRGLLLMQAKDRELPHGVPVDSQN